MIHRMRNPLRFYDWGSNTYIQQLCGRQDLNGTPVAEMWMGAHASSPSVLEDGSVDLAAYLAQTSRCSTASGGLSFLMKVLSAERPLSIQAHPDKAQSEDGFRRENATGIDITSPHRCYTDPNHKPELMVALEPFSALCGFRPYDDIRAAFQRAGILSMPYCVEFAARQDPHTWRGAFSNLIALPSREANKVVNTALNNADHLHAPEAEWLRKLSQLYPGDIGALAPLYMNLIDLKPREGLFLRPGTLHAYLRGTGIEIMANSDNTLRGGLSNKHIAVNELTSILDFKGGFVPVIEPSEVRKGVYAYPVSVPDFKLYRLEMDGEEQVLGEVAQRCGIALCLEGQCRMQSEADRPVSISRGESAFVDSGKGALRITGKGCLYLGISGVVFRQ